jgi:hypothetical protein
MAKLTLSVDDLVISRAKEYAKLHGTSVSEIVESYLAAISRPDVSSEPGAPVLRSLRGILKSGEPDHYHEYLEQKYR